MFINVDKPLPFIKEYLEELNSSIEKLKPGCGLTWGQKTWLGFCLMGIIVTNSVCWAKFSRASLGKLSKQAISWMFLKSVIPWDLLLYISVTLILEKYGITEGTLVIDDSENKRSKSVKKIHKAHKIFDKKNGGYITGQQVVLLLLVTSRVTIPVTFAFYMPDPELTAWYKESKKLKKQKVAKKKHPPKPAKKPQYPTKQELALTLLKEFKLHHPDISVKIIIADALYGTKKFMHQASDIFGEVQVISQLRATQSIRFRDKWQSISSYFDSHPGVSRQVIVRGSEIITAEVSSARLYVRAHKQKLFIIAIKYEGELEYRYLVASDLSWRTEDIVRAYTLRWLVEVFFEDWKLYEGWGQLAKQPGFDGSNRSLILSLLLDHCLLLHPEQKARLENKMPAATVGSLLEKIKVESLLLFINDLLMSDNPQAELERLSEAVKDVFQLNLSKKHMNNKDLGRLEATPSLKHKAQTA